MSAAAQMPVLRCLIVDDSVPFLDAARSLLEREGFAVVGVASTGAEALKQAMKLQPDVTLVDIDLGTESGFDVARSLDAYSDRLFSRVILLSTHSERDFAELIEESPADGFLAKSELSAGGIYQLLA